MVVLINGVSSCLDLQYYIEFAANFFYIMTMNSKIHNMHYTAKSRFETVAYYEEKFVNGVLE